LFHPISLHGSIEHFTSDSKNIKVSLNFLAKYIKNKQVNGSKANDLDDFNGMGDAIWNLFPQFMRPNRTPYILIKNLTLSGPRFLQSSPRELFPLTMVTRRK